MKSLVLVLGLPFATCDAKIFLLLYLPRSKICFSNNSLLFSYRRRDGEKVLCAARGGQAFPPVLPRSGRLARHSTGWGPAGQTTETTMGEGKRKVHAKMAGRRCTLGNGVKLIIITPNPPCIYWWHLVRHRHRMNA